MFWSNSFLKGVDYFVVQLTTNEIRTQFGAGKNAGKTMNVLTESGYLMLVKSSRPKFGRLV